MLTRLIAAALLSTAAGAALACPHPSLVVIPEKEQVAAMENEVRAATAKYFADMNAFLNCIQAELAAAGGETAAPPTIREALIRRNNAAVLEFEAVAKWFEANVGPLAVAATVAN